MDAKTGLKRLALPALACSILSSEAAALDLPNPLNFFGRVENAAPPPEEKAPPAPESLLDCPEILVESGGSSLREPAGAGAGELRHQLSLGDMARECRIQDGKISIKVGVEGAVILGPAGKPGSYFGALRILARRQKDEAILQSKTYRVGAVVPVGAARAEFRLVADPLVVPFASQHAASDYEILVGFEGAEARAPRERKRAAR